MQAAVSVIVAVYNAEKTLVRCLDSLVGQELKDIEIILVDDGSQDASGAICDRYASSDSRIKVVHKENEGVAATKQKGLDQATGEYFVFLDSDDYVDKTIYRKLFEKAKEENDDIVCCDILRLEQGGTRVEGHPIPSFTHEVFLDGLIDRLFGSICNRIVRRALLEQYGIRFKDAIHYGEDKLLLVEILGKSLNSGKRLKIGYIPEALLYYDTVVNPNSLMKLDRKKKLDAQLCLWEEMGKYLDLRLFGKTYYWLLLKHGFTGFWNRIYTRQEFESRFAGFRKGIQEYAPLSSYKRLVLMACSGKWELAQKMRWLAYGRILREKWQLARDVRPDK